MNRVNAEGLSDAARSLKAMVYGDRDISVEAEVGFFMLAKIFHCYVVDHTKKPGM